MSVSLEKKDSFLKKDYNNCSNLDISKDTEVKNILDDGNNDNDNINDDVNANVNANDNVNDESSSICYEQSKKKKKKKKHKKHKKHKNSLDDSNNVSDKSSSICCEQYKKRTPNKIVNLVWVLVTVFIMFLPALLYRYAAWCIDAHGYVINTTDNKHYSLDCIHECGEPLNISQHNCSKCGKAISKTTLINRMNYCNKCGLKSENKGYCTKCGGKIIEQTYVKVQDTNFNNVGTLKILMLLLNCVQLVILGLSVPIISCAIYSYMYY